MTRHLPAEKRMRKEAPPAEERRILARCVRKEFTEQIDIAADRARERNPGMPGYSLSVLGQE